MEPRKQLEQALIEKAMKDESFRKQLIEDPRSAIQEEFKMKIPDSLNLIVLEEDQKNFYLILPSNPSPGGEMELTEAELEGVSAGNMYSIGCEYT